MKRITAVLLAFAFALSGIGAARADGIDVKVQGEWDFAFGWVGNKGFTDSVNSSGNSGRRDNDNFEAAQRIRTQINFVTSEYLQAVLMFEIGNMYWGRPEQGAALDADQVNVKTKNAYLDWIIPETEISVRMGIQYLALPSTRMGSPVFGADVAGVVVNSPLTDWLSATAFWMRPFDQYDNDNENDGPSIDSQFSDTVDAFGLILPVSMDGWDMSPYFVYGFVGANSGLYDYLYTGEQINTVSADGGRGSHAKVWWAGLNFNLDMFDPLSFSFDYVYGHLQKNNLTGLAKLLDAGAGDATWRGAEGWYLGATLDYKLDFMTPGIFGWYATGDDEDDLREGTSGRLPVLGTDDGMTATSFGMVGYYNIGNGGDSAAVTSTATGTWGIGIQLADITFIEDLSHTLRFAYYQGTNDPDIVRNGRRSAPDGRWESAGVRYAADMLYLTEDDQVFEINFDHQYQIYENLTAVLELGYLNLRSDRSTWGGRGLDESDSAWKAQVLFRYSF